MTEIKIGDTVRWRMGGKRTAVVTHLSAAREIATLDRQLHGDDVHYVDDLVVVKPAMKGSR